MHTTLGSVWAAIILAVAMTLASPAHALSERAAPAPVTQAV